MTKRSFQIIFLTVLFCTLASLPAQAKFTAANVKGSYGLLINQWSEPTSGQGGALGIATFDGINSVTGSITIVNGTGLVVNTIAAGSTYVVKPNGTGSMTLMLTSSSGNQTATLDFAVNSVSASIAKSLQLMGVNSQTTNTNVLAGTALSINLSGSATAANVSGTYSFLLNGWTSGTQQAIVGTMTFDGVSKVTLTFTVQKGPGTIQTGTGSGSYSVNSDGSGSLTASLSNGNTTVLDFVLNSVSGGIARGFQILDTQSTSSFTTTGSAVHQ